MRLCIWSRWCGGLGKFRQKSRIVGVDEQQVVAQAEVEFELKEMEGHATNVHYFGGVQFQQYGIASCRNFSRGRIAAAVPVAGSGSEESLTRHVIINSVIIGLILIAKFDTTGAAHAEKRSFSARFSAALLSAPLGAIAELRFLDWPTGSISQSASPTDKATTKRADSARNGHLGEDWDGLGGGNTDLRDPVYSIGDGVVVFARDVHLGWGNVVIVRHVFREAGALKTIDALYGHLNTILVRAGQNVTRGQQLATMGTAHGVYDAHLHFEIRKNIAIGMNRAAFPRDFSNYYDPSKFLLSHRHLPAARRTYPIAMNTFTHDAKYNVEGLRNFRRHSRSHVAIGRRVKTRARVEALKSRRGDRRTQLFSLAQRLYALSPIRSTLARAAKSK